MATHSLQVSATALMLALVSQAGLGHDQDDDIRTHGRGAAPNVWVATDLAVDLFNGRGDRILRYTHVRPANTGFKAIQIDGSDGGLWFTATNDDKLVRLSRAGEEAVVVEVVSPLAIAVESRDGSVWTSTQPAARSED